MKYIKIFEDFDQYDVKKYSNDDNGNNYRDMRSIAIVFEAADVEIVINELTVRSINVTYYDSSETNDSYDYIVISKGSLAIEEHGNGIELYYFGDYSFGVAEYNLYAGRGVDVEVFDNVYDAIDEIIHRYESAANRLRVSEGLDKYDFGKYENGSDIDTICNQIMGNRIMFDVNEFSLIENEIDTDVRLVEHVANHSFISLHYNSGAAKYYNVFYLDDYCYSILTMDRYDLVVCAELIDNIDDVIENLKIKIN